MTHLAKHMVSYLGSFQFLRNTTQFVIDHISEHDYQLLNSPLGRIHLVSNAEIIQKIFVRREENFVKSRIYWGKLKEIVGPCLGTAEGDEWLWLKRLQQPYYSNKKILDYLPKVVRNAQYQFGQWQDSQTKTITEEFATINVSCILSTIFGIENNDLTQEIAHHISSGEKIIFDRSRFPLLRYFPHHNKLTREYLDFFESFTKKAIEESKRDDKIANLLDELVAQSPYKGTTESELRSIRNEIIVHLGASTETAAIAQTWTLYNLAKHPSILADVKKEIEEATGGVPISIDHLTQLHLLHKVVKESMRLFPPSHAIIRDIHTPFQEMGISFKKSDIFFGSVFGLHRNPRYWNKSNEFIPQRFNKEEAHIPYSYTPFGFGKHKCIGRHLALPMMVLIIASFLQRFDFKILNKEEIRPKPLSTLKPDPPIQIKITQTQNSPYYENTTSQAARS